MIGFGGWRSRRGKRLAAAQVRIDVASEALIAELLIDAWEHKAAQQTRPRRAGG